MRRFSSFTKMDWNGYAGCEGEPRIARVDQKNWNDCSNAEIEVVIDPRGIYVAITRNDALGMSMVNQFVINLRFSNEEVHPQERPSFAHLLLGRLVLDAAHFCPGDKEYRQVLRALGFRAES